MVSDPRMLSPALQQALDTAQRALEAARQRCIQHGLDPDETRADLERRLSALELADVYADVEAHLQQVARDALPAAPVPPRPRRSTI